jgi:hypothetical protein
VISTYDSARGADILSAKLRQTGRLPHGAT